MAVSKAEIKSSYPLPSYNYKVEIDGQTLAFSEVSGMSIEYETTTYKESPKAGGPPGPRVMRMPAQGTAATATLKKGVVRVDSLAALYDWINSTQMNQVTKKDIFVRLCDEEGNAVISWKMINAFPTKLSAPTFDANSNEAAIETMELMGDGVYLEEA
jgi:phage tail-like protein